MHDRFIKRIEADIERLKASCEKETGKDITAKIERRIGRLMQQNSRGASFFRINTRYDRLSAKTIIDVELVDGDAHWKRMTEGHYLLPIGNLRPYGKPISILPMQKKRSRSIKTICTSGQYGIRGTTGSRRMCWSALLHL